MAARPTIGDIRYSVILILSSIWTVIFSPCGFIIRRICRARVRVESYLATSAIDKERWPTAHPGRIMNGPVSRLTLLAIDPPATRTHCLLPKKTEATGSSPWPMLGYVVSQASFARQWGNA